MVLFISRLPLGAVFRRNRINAGATEDCSVDSRLFGRCETIAVALMNLCDVRAEIRPSSTLDLHFTAFAATVLADRNASLCPPVSVTIAVRNHILEGKDTSTGFRLVVKTLTKDLIDGWVKATDLGNITSSGGIPLRDDDSLLVMTIRNVDHAGTTTCLNPLGSVRAEAEGDFVLPTKINRGVCSALCLDDIETSNHHEECDPTAFARGCRIDSIH